MALAVTYTTINGQIVHEDRGGVERYYVPDPLGNTVALVDTTGSVTDTWIYSPYGVVLSHGGSSATAFTSFGTWGYSGCQNRIYVKARRLLADLTRWATIDPIWPRASGYGYCQAMPELVVDPLGYGSTRLQFWSVPGFRLPT